MMTNLPKTAAETALIRQFAGLQQQGVFPPDTQRAGFLPSLPQRQAAIAALGAHGLPTRRLEAWHYSDLRRLLPDIAAFSDKIDGVELPPLLAEAPVLTLINGRAGEAPNSGNKVFKAISLAANSEAETQYAGFDTELEDKGAIISQINTAFARDGWHIEVAAGNKAVIELQNIQNSGQSHSRLAASVGKAAQLTLIERQAGDNQASFLSFASRLELAEEAEVTWIIVRQRGLNAAELNRFQAILGQKSRLRLYVVNLGGQLVRQEIHVDLAGEGADFQLRGINLLAGSAHTDNTMVVRHLVENTASTEIFRNVVAEQAHGVFQGMIRVAQAAQKTDARMACNSLILSDEAEFSARPELEIFADDVACGHGATVAEIDHNHLFYLMARGIPEGAARILLIKAFVGALLDELPENLAGALHKVLAAWLESHFTAA
ncbi:Fe-S cluster assembly protein SufD [Candidatus Tokpelaia sp.]|uniref:Fe-S cluster assembly protein SufD n=1 Tax=Candidatus Tokpelaia sp. TaxID=2233777 RepID=UPI0012393D75|nr:Fe-S cluster assembly protein SufD [Candidatus Tokpelaia sp.]KAA6404784.1 Fe-S cluster assembly protein SufD [Candidatus Tokpelaia sp.]